MRVAWEDCIINQRAGTEEKGKLSRTQASLKVISRNRCCDFLELQCIEFSWWRRRLIIAITRNFNWSNFISTLFSYLQRFSIKIHLCNERLQRDLSTDMSSIIHDAEVCSITEHKKHLKSLFLFVSSQWAITRGFKAFNRAKDTNTLVPKNFN